MVEIPEYKRDESKDYLLILKSLNEIPFPVGRNLLADFLVGDSTNKSISKNELYNLINFSSLESINKEKILDTISNLIINGYVEESSSSFNKFMKILSVTKKGHEELINPKLNSKKLSIKYKEIETQISDHEMAYFKELNDFLKGFNLEQKKAIVSSKEKILCVAGAGCGKTAVLTKRIEFLHKLKRVKSEDILAITFTKKAKEEMEKRLKQKGIETNVQTFNSFCERILLKHGGKIYGKKVRVANYNEKMIGLLKALENIGITLENAVNKYFNFAQKNNKTEYELQNNFLNDCYSVLEYYKLSNKDLSNLFSEQNKKDMDLFIMVKKIVYELEKYMKTTGLRTYADQIIETISFFKKYPKYIPNFKHILVDEYQDVNSSQIEILNLLKPENLFCVGDPRQAIFGWRGSNIDYILNFKKNFIDAEIIYLKKNYRSNNHIVSLMNNSIRELKMPDLIHNFEGDKQIKLYSFTDEENEFDFIYRKISTLEVDRNQIFVLSRTNKQLIELSNFLKSKSIKHIIKNENNSEIEANNQEIVLSTIHGIKGLEAEIVFLIGCTQNNFPCKAQEHPIMDLIKIYEYDKEEEERRLFYVAISRAKNQIYLTYSGKKHTHYINKEMLEELDKINF